MQVRFNCPTDKCVAIIEYEPLEEAPGVISCPRCHKDHTMGISDSMRRENTVDVCAVCGCRELFIRKDFPRAFGVTVVVVAGVASVILLSKHFLAAYGVLLAAVLVDLALYLVIGKVTTCYACRAEYRKAKFNQTHEGFDLATSEKY